MKPKAKPKNQHARSNELALFLKMYRVSNSCSQKPVRESIGLSYMTYQFVEKGQATEFAFNKCIKFLKIDEKELIKRVNQIQKALTI